MGQKNNCLTAGVISAPRKKRKRSIHPKGRMTWGEIIWLKEPEEKNAQIVEQQEATTGMFPGPFHQIVREGYRSFVPSKISYRKPSNVSTEMRKGAAHHRR
jgi:hypothetical protein